jgi:serine/threonine protein kinase/tetratricopeptide (TPR) repeat protein
MSERPYAEERPSASIPVEGHGKVFGTVPVRKLRFSGNRAASWESAENHAPPSACPGESGGPPEDASSLRTRPVVGWDGIALQEGFPLWLGEVGSEIFGYRLCRELGRGAFARVFLAEQADLAGRLVVLKISAIEGKEPQALAQMQHTHIVPIYSLHEHRRLGVRAVCMPYLGGASLARVLEALWQKVPQPTQGWQLVEALHALHDSGPSCRTSVTPSPCPLVTLSYVRAVAWLVARLAGGLQHAHERGVLHCDIKSSNVLLAADGQPLLLDFNVAQWVEPEPNEVILGGTAAYASPEQLEVLLHPTVFHVGRVDRRSDIYALGIVLYEMVSGHSPFAQGGGYSRRRTLLAEMARERSQTTPRLRDRRPDVPWSLESIVRRCLAPDPDRRYHQAEHLGEDLRRFLDDRPLRYAPELSQVERVRKWLRRHPRLTSTGSVAAVAALLLLGAAAAVVAVRDNLARAREQIQATEERDRRQAYDAGTLRALCLVNTVSDLDDRLAEGARVCEQTLALYGVLDREDWQEQPAWQRLAPDERRRLGENTRELLQLLAWARCRTAPGERARLRQALALLDRAEAVAGLSPSPALRTERARYLEALGETEASRRSRQEAERLQPVSTQDHYLLATAYARQGGRASLARAVAELNLALQRNPQHYWALVQRGICHQELSDLTLAAADFSSCIGLRPELPWGYFNRGYVLGRAGKREQAIEDFTAALAQDPGFVPASVNRGLVRLELKQYAAALADFDEAQGRERNDAFLHAGRGLALEALGRHSEADAAFAAAFTRAESLPARERARITWTYGFAVASRLPDQAGAAFDAVLREDPRQPQALYGKAMLAVERGHLDEALTFADRAVEAGPGSVDARRCRAIVLARLGDLARAEQDINGCLEREPRSGVTLYAAACVAGRAAARFPSSSAAAQALDLLRRALAEGYGRDRAECDPDLAGIRNEPGFAKLLGKPHVPGNGRRSSVLP